MTGNEKDYSKCNTGGKGLQKCHVGGRIQGVNDEGTPTPRLAVGADTSLSFLRRAKGIFM